MSDVVGRVKRRAAKLSREVRSLVATPWLSLRSASSRRSLIDEDGLSVVSLTSYADRLRTVHLSIESIGAGRVRPRRLILWTDPDVKLADLPAQLRRLQRRGLEIRASHAAIGPHTKYFPYVVSQSSHTSPLVTADDDSLYPRDWLAGLEGAGEAHPGEVVCYRAHELTMSGSGSIAPYNEWPPVTETTASLRHFATGVSGVRYPPAFLDRLRDAGDAFMNRCPKADDVWLHAQAVAAGTLVRQVRRRPRKFPEIARTQTLALHRSNTARSANDPQIAATYDESMLAALRATASRR